MEKLELDEYSPVGKIVAYNGIVYDVVSDSVYQSIKNIIVETNINLISESMFKTRYFYKNRCVFIT